jgi:O-antigen/teichoic acid export membrane protein
MFQALFAMLGGIVVARALGPSGRGTISVLVSICTMGVLIASLGFQHSGVYFLGRFRDQRHALISNLLLFGAIGGTLAALGLVAAVLLFRHALLNQISLGLFLLYLPFVPCNYFNQIAQGVVLAQGRVAIYNLPQALSAFALLFGVLLVLQVFGHVLAPVLAVRIAPDVITAVFLAVYVGRTIGFRFNPSATWLRRQLGYSLKNYAASLTWTVLLQSDVLICNYFLGSRPTGVYSVAISLGISLTVLSSGVGLFIFQRTSSDPDRPRRINNTNRAMRVLSIITAVGAASLALTAHWVVPLVYGARYVHAAPTLILLLPGLLMLCLENVLANFLAGEGNPPTVYYAPLAGMVVNIVANIFVVPRWGIEGAATTSTVGYGLVFVLVTSYYLRSTDSRLRDILVLRREDLRAMWRLPSQDAIAAG